MKNKINREVEEKQNTAAAPAHGRFDIYLPVRKLISRSLKSTKLCRYEVAAEMSKLLGKDITKSQLDTWSAESKDGHRFPLEYFPALTEATGDISLLRLVCERAGGHFIECEETIRMKIERVREGLVRLKAEEKELCSFLESIK